jgi:nucleotide-binding universal stress UspA family protein
MKSGPYIVVVGMDFSDLANRALLEAFDLASRRNDAEVHVVSIVPGPNLDPSYQIPAYALAASQDDNLVGAVERLRAHVQAQFEAFDAALTPRPRGGSLKIVSHARVDSPVLGIVQLASDLGADLIVVGTHGRQGIARVLMGSVAESTVRHAQCPVLVIPPPGGVAPVKIEPPCSMCLRARADSGGRELWCEQHRERHGRRHTYHQSDRAAGETNLPLVMK